MTAQAASAHEYININAFEADDGTQRFEVELFQGINILQVDRGSSDQGFKSRETAASYARAVFPSARIE